MSVPVDGVACTSDETGELYKALIAFQKLGLVVRKEANNTFYKSKYATLGDVLQKIQTPLAEHGLAVVQLPFGENGLVTRVIHESGQWIQCVSQLNPIESMIAKGTGGEPDKYGVTPQGLGSAITYARRYAVTAMLNVIVDDEEDDDGNKASNAGGSVAGRARGSAGGSGSSGGSASSGGRSAAPAGQSKAEPPPAPKTEDERVALIRTVIMKDPILTVEDFQRFEGAIVRHVTTGGLSKDNASASFKLLARQAALAMPVTDLVAKIGPKVLELRDRGLLVEADYLDVTTAFEEAASKNNG